MIFTELELAGAYLIDLEKRADSRGFFARSWCQAELAAHGLGAPIVQANVALSHHRGTLRGLHYQTERFAEAKLVRVTRGAIYDVIVDLRTESPTFLRWLGVELSADDYRMLYVPERFAHGYLTRADDTEVTYQVTQSYTPQAERGIRFDDPALGIEWAGEVRVISDKDRSWPDLVPSEIASSTSNSIE